MNPVIKAFLAMGLIGAGASVALAQEGMDTDGDGVYSYAELLAVYPTLDEEAFAALDVNGDGVVDNEEYAAAIEAGALVADG